MNFLLDIRKLYQNLKEMRKLKESIQKTYKRVTCWVWSEVKKIEKTCAILESEYLEEIPQDARDMILETFRSVKSSVKSFEWIQEINVR